MVRRLLGLLILSKVLSACVLDGAHPGERGVFGDVSISWTFENRSCAWAHEVYSVRVEVPALGPAGNMSVGCEDGFGRNGTVLRNVAPGVYAYRVEAYDFFNRLLYQGAGTFTVNGNVMEWVDLSRPNQANSFAYVSWAFPSNSQFVHPNCNQAGVRFVDVSLDGAPYTRFECALGQYGNSVVTPYVMSGVHSIELVGLTDELYPMYRYVGQLTTVGTRPVSNEYTLNWAVGGVAIAWNLLDGGRVLSCGQALISTVRVDFRDAQGHWVYGESGDVQACDAAPIVYNYLPPGTYQVFLTGVSAQGSIFAQSNVQTPPVVQVRAGEFAEAHQALNVALYRN